MKIHDYITKRGVAELPPSLTCPVVFPHELFENDLKESFAGMNKDRSVAVTLYDNEDLFVVVEQKPKRKITGKISIDCPGLSS